MLDPTREVISSVVSQNKFKKTLKSPSSCDFTPPHLHQPSFAHLILSPPLTLHPHHEPSMAGPPNNRRVESTPPPSLHHATVLPPSQANGLWRVVAATAASTQHQPARPTDMYVDLESCGGGGSGFSCIQKKRRVISESILQSPRRHQIPAADASPARRLCALSP